MQRFDAMAARLGKRSIESFSSYDTYQYLQGLASREIFFFGSAFEPRTVCTSTYGCEVNFTGGENSDHSEGRTEYRKDSR